MQPALSWDVAAEFAPLSETLNVNMRLLLHCV